MAETATLSGKDREVGAVLAVGEEVEDMAAALVHREVMVDLCEEGKKLLAVLGLVMEAVLGLVMEAVLVVVVMEQVQVGGTEVVQVVVVTEQVQVVGMELVLRVVAVLPVGMEPVRPVGMEVLAMDMEVEALKINLQEDGQEAVRRDTPRIE